jgi:hypothetical protein
MASREIPVEVRSLLAHAIGSYEELETLLLLRAEPDRIWTADEVAASLKLPLAIATDALDRLWQQQLLRVPTGIENLSFQYDAESTEAHSVEALAREYEQNRLGVIGLLSSNAIERVRTRAMRLFADAFIIGRKKDDDG